MKTAAGTSVLRGIAVNGQPRSLRPPRTHPALASIASTSIADNTPSDPAAALLAARHADAERRGYAAGYAHGHAQGVESGSARGLEDAEARVADAIVAANETLAAAAAAKQRDADAASAAQRDRIRAIAHDLERAAADRIGALAGDAVELAFEAVCRIVGEGEDRAERVRDLVGVATRRLAGATLLRVRIHPDDLAIVGEARRGATSGEASGAADGGSRGSPAGRNGAVIEWIADPGVDSPGCIVESDRGSIDARLGMQLARLRDVWSRVAR